MQSVKNIIFDLGGIFIDIHYLRTKKAFENLGIQDFDSFFMQHNSNPLFAGFEKGLVTDEDFFEGFRKETNTRLSDEEITTAWNAMLGDFRKNSIEWLKKIGVDYKVFLYSNTNHVHHVFFSKLFADTIGGTLESLFDKAYFSHELHHRKPDAAGFLAILEEQGLAAGETLFIDDTSINVEAASALGIHTILLQSPMRVEDIKL